MGSHAGAMGTRKDGAVAAAFRYLFNDVAEDAKRARNFSEIQRLMRAQAKAQDYQTDDEIRAWKRSLTLPDSRVSRGSRYDSTGRSNFDYYMEKNYSYQWYDDPALWYSAYPVAVLAVALGGEYVIGGYYAASNYVLANPVAVVDVIGTGFSGSAPIATGAGITGVLGCATLNCDQLVK